MTTTRRMQSALRAALKKEDAALEKRLPECGTQQPDVATDVAPEEATEKAATRVKGRTASSVAPKARPKTEPKRIAPSHDNATLSPEPDPVPAKPEKRIQETFSMTRQDLQALKAIKARIKKSGGKISRSELLRAGIHLLSGAEADDVRRLTDRLPPLRKAGPKGK